MGFDAFQYLEHNPKRVKKKTTELGSGGLLPFLHKKCVWIQIKFSGGMLLWLDIRGGGTSP